MASLAQVITSLRPDVARSGLDPIVWWNQYGKNELTNELQRLGRTDVLDFINRGGDLGAWLANYGSKEYNNIFAEANNRAAASAMPQQFANQVGADKVFRGPVFSEALPYQQAWNRLLPTVTQEAEAQINPYVQRQLSGDLNNYYRQQAATGGGRFGFGGAGQIQAESDRNRKAQTLDWVNTRQQGFNDLFYKPAEQAYNRAIELGQTPTTPKVPTWEELTKQYSQLA